MSPPLLPLPERLDLAHLKNVLQAWASRLSPLFALAPVYRGRLLAVSLSSGAQSVEHRLGRRPEGWFLVSPRAAATVHQHDTADTLRLPLTASAAVDASLWIW